MIEFHCKNCGQKLSVQDQHSGKRVKCPKCGSVGVVPDNSDKIKFHCQNCGQSIRVPQIYAGKKGKCPKCKNVVIVPTREATPAKSTSMVSFTCAMCDETIQVPETSIGQTIECPECGSYIETSSGAAPGKSDASADDDSYEEETEEYEDSEGVDRRIIVGISAVAAVVVVGLIILVAALRFSRSRPAGRPETLQAQRQVADTDSRPRPVTSDTQSTEQVVQEPSQEETLPEEHASDEDNLYKQTKIAFESRRDGNYDIYVMNTDGSEQKRLTKNRARDSDPSWSPDGKKIAFRTRAQGNIEIYVMNADGSEQKNLTNNPASDWDPSWSPDGKKIAFSSRRDGNMEIYVMNADGSEQKNLTNNPALDRYPSWSPDGTKIAFCSMRDGNPQIYITNADGSEQRRLTNNRGGDRFPSWSPDGKKIAFSSQKYGFENIYVMNADGSEQRRLTNNPADEVSPSWSPDGMKIAFESDRDGLTNIYVMNADGSEQKRLTDNPSYDKTPTWSPFLSLVAKEETQPTEPVVQEAPPKPDSLGAELRVKLIQKFSPGKYEIIQTETDKSILTVQGRTVTTNESQDKWYEVDVSEPDSSGQTTCVVTVTRIRESDPSGSSYDTDDPDSLRGNATAQIISKIFLNRKFVSKFGQDGKIVSVSGWDQLWDSISKGVSEEVVKASPMAAQRADQISRQVVQQLKQEAEAMGEKAYIQSILGLVYEIIPDQPVGVGAVWHKVTSENAPFIGAAKTSAEYELREIEQTPEGKIAHITCAGTVKHDQSKKTQFGPMSMNFNKTDLRQKGEIRLNVDTGLMISSRMEVKGEIEASVIARGRNIPMNFQISQTSETTTRPAISNGESKRIAPSEPLARKEDRTPTVSRTESPLIGKPAPSFTLRDLSGKRVSLSDFKGKVVILDFWATWCPPCVVEIPHFILLYEQYKDQGLAVVGISTDRKGVGIVRSFAQKNRINYPILMADGRVQAAYGGIRAIPTTFIIDSAGLIKHQYIGYQDKIVFETAIKPLLADIEPQ